MNCHHHSALRIAALLAVVVFCCGFSWGLKKSDPCNEARTNLKTFSTATDPGKKAKLEKAILKACPNGAAGLFIKGLQAEQAANKDDAISLYREALAKDDTIAEAHGNLGLLLSERGLDQEASVELTKGLMGWPDPRYHLAIAPMMNTCSLPALALFHYNEALKAFPDDVTIHDGMAKAYVQLGQFDQAEKEFVRLTALKPGEVKYRLGLADVYRKAGKLDQAVEVLRSCLGDNPANKEGHRLLAEVLMEKGDRETARKEYLLAGVDVTINPEDFATKGDEYVKEKEYGKAISAYQTALKGRPAWPDIQYKLGKAQLAAGRDDDALATFTALAKAGLKDGSVYYELGLLHERSGQLDEAISAYSSSVVHDPDNVNAHRRLAEIFTWRGSFKQAAEQYRELVRLRGDNPLYHLNLGQTYGRMKDLKRAMAEYQAAIRLDPNNIEGHRELARIFVRNNQPAKAEHHYREVLRLNSDDETARNALITLFIKQKRYDDLTTFIKEWLDKAPDDPQRHYRLGIVYEFKKEYDMAVAEYKKALELQPNDAKMLLALGRTYMKSGRLSESREMLEAAQKANPTLAEPQLLLSSIGNGSRYQKNSSHTADTQVRKSNSKHNSRHVKKSRRKKTKNKH